MVPFARHLRLSDGSFEFDVIIVHSRHLLNDNRPNHLWNYVRRRVLDLLDANSG